MTVEVALFLLTICSAFTGLITEAIKKMFTVNKPTIVAAIVSVIVGAAVPICYLIINKIPFGAQEIIYTVAMVILTWLCATIGYDKVMEVIRQIFGGKSEE